MNEKTKIGYDFDGVLGDQYWMQIRAYNDAHKSDTEVYIITKRSPNVQAQEVFYVAYKLDIPKENVFFTDGGVKSPLINQLGIQYFYDDKMENKTEIESNSNCIVYLV